MEDKEVDTLFEQLNDAILMEDSDLCRSIARKLEAVAESPDDLLIVASAHIDGGDPERALEIIGNLEGVELEPRNDLGRRMMIGEAQYILGNPRQALATFDQVTPIDSRDVADLCWWSGLCHDHTGDQAQAEIEFKKALAADPALPPPTAISEEEVGDLVRQVIAELPAAIGSELDQIPVVIEDLPPSEVVRSSKGEVHPDILGLYTGHSLQERSWLDAGWAPSSIHIFRRNLERACTGEHQLREEIRITLLHELGHHFGLNEEDLDHLGLA